MKDSAFHFLLDLKDKILLKAKGSFYLNVLLILHTNHILSPSYLQATFHPLFRKDEISHEESQKPGKLS